MNDRPFILSLVKRVIRGYLSKSLINQDLLLVSIIRPSPCTSMMLSFKNSLASLSLRHALLSIFVFLSPLACKHAAKPEQASITQSLLAPSQQSWLDFKSDLKLGDVLIWNKNDRKTCLGWGAATQHLSRLASHCHASLVIQKNPVLIIEMISATKKKPLAVRSLEASIDRTLLLQGMSISKHSPSFVSAKSQEETIEKAFAFSKRTDIKFPVFHKELLSRILSSNRNSSKNSSENSSAQNPATEPRKDRYTCSSLIGMLLKGSINESIQESFKGLGPTPDDLYKTLRPSGLLKANSYQAF